MPAAQSESDLAKEIFNRLKSINNHPSQAQCLKLEAPVKAYVDGCFDLVHAGHFNAIRQASLLCDGLVVGVVSTEEIEIVKGPVVLT